MDQLNSFLKLIKHAQKVDEFDDRLEATFEASQLKERDMNFDNWLKSEVLGLQIDTEWVEVWADIQTAQNDEECFINLSKQDFIKNVITVDIDANHFVFFSIDYFKEWMEKHDSPFLAAHPLYQTDKNILWVNELQRESVGSRLSILPICSRPEQYFVPIDAPLPGDAEIKAHVHFVSRDAVTIIPEAFRLPDLAFDDASLKPFFLNYTKLLAVCLVKEFYSEEKVIISGLKRIALLLAQNGMFDISLNEIKTMENAVRWVYAEKTETRLILLMDRVSLDLPEGGDMLPSIFGKINQALEQARNRYEFVIMDRQEAHAKELADLQKDVKLATEGYSQSINSIVSGLLKDALSSVFIIALGVLSRLIGKEELLQSRQSHLLFRGLSVYLFISFISKLIVNKTILDLSIKNIQYWKNATRNHMPADELDGHIKTCTEPYKKFYHRSAVVIALIYIFLCYGVWDFPAFMSNSPLIISKLVLTIISWVQTAWSFYF